MLLAVGEQRQPVVIGGADDHEVRVQDVFFLVVFHGLTVQGHNRAAGLFDHGLRGGGIPFRSRPESRVNVRAAFGDDAEP